MLEKRQATLQKVLALDRNRVVAVLAATIPDPERGHHYVSFAANYLPDARLVPVVAARIRASEGALLNDMLKRIRRAPKEFLRGLVPVLIEHALDSDYEGRGGPSGMWRSWSALAETTQLLDKITEGKTGIDPVSASELIGSKGEARKAELRAAWRKWWAANKDNWPPKEEAKPEAQKEPPPQEVPEVPDKGQADEPAPDPTKDTGQPAQPAPAN